MKPVVADPELIAACGLYCGACGAYLKERCPGCRENHRATWCAIRKCCQENRYANCAECAQVANVAECRKFNNFMSKIFGVLFRSNRAACIALIREQGRDGFARHMAERKQHTVKR